MSTGHMTLRRHFLLTTALALPAAATLGAAFARMPAAEAAERLAPSLDSYKPVFFSAEEWDFVKAACDRLIPSDAEGPGALDTNVPVFIDQELNGPYGQAADWYMEGPFQPDAPALMGFQLPYPPQEIYRRGIRATGAFCRKTHGKDFEALDAATRDAVLTGLQHNEIRFSDFGEPQLKAGEFFSFLLTNTKEGYLSDPMYGGNKGMAAWKMINFPGARASFLEWVGQHNVRYPLGPVSLLGERA
ncbi:gluconate 2-dehydrogenase subunit 3 family protein [Roseomonas gilardii subsp. gilardii]|uniref:gluconate 2-dehydrogenase subunit 3 family protein n=1 Tax=Roseomonas gilardii TaxID=257708 RepID=UPI001FF71A0B|nr:gluconate 2-dehydrogenase subunit 3 family protein [Roseomonas gilardii]UPG73487.1 gluconate 2-dehydrogenase subunit 3 family protein [Roseomonas gilardii subsp. gilardii]